MASGADTPTLAAKIRRLRKERGWSAQRLADQCAKLGEPALTRSTIAKIESGVRRSVHAGELAVLARAFEVSPGVLLGETMEASGHSGASTNALLQDHREARPIVTLPHRAGVLPVRAASYQRRTGPSLVISAMGLGETTPLSSNVSGKIDVLSGLGGVGKTQVALDYTQQLWTAGEVDLWVWVTAGSREAIVSSFARLAVDLTGVEDTDSEHGAQRLLEWLTTSPARWLVVLDDVQTPADLRGLWPPITPTGQTIVTTRRRDAALRGYGRRLVEVDVFTPEEAEAYLRAALVGQPHLVEGAAELAVELGCLPLALAQAAGYMMDRGLSCADYRARWTSQRRNLASLLPEPDGLPDEHRATVATTWLLSVEQADQLQPTGVARLLLDVASVLDPNGIPAAVFEAPAVTSLLAHHTRRDIDAGQARDGLMCLHRLNLITLDPNSDTRAVRVHTLVQRATRDALTAPQRAAVLRVAADALLHIWPAPERDTVLGQVLRANTDALAETAGEHLWKPRAHALLFRAGISLGDRGLITEAHTYFHRLLASARRHLGPDHPDTLTTRSHLARWRGEAGDPTGAVAAFEELFNDSARVLGPDHPDSLTTRGNLAYWRGEAGDPTGAASASEELLTDALRVWGPDHPDTLANRSNLALWRGEAGDSAGAVAAFENVVIDSVRILGPDHPVTLTTRSNLAHWRGEAGDSAGAVAAFENVVIDSVRILGPDHPDTLTARHNLARWQGEVGDLAGAATAAEEVLTDRVRILGPDHPDTLTTRNNLAFWRGKAGDPAGAVAAYEQLLTDCFRVLGADHPDTLTARSNLALWRGKAEDPAGAVAAFEQLLPDVLRVLGPDHPNILTIRNNLAHWRSQSSERVTS
ncbi:FxSxx-COOH system tetratricopeptide repeat protein [Amycolatopsis sp. FBCC-B4732]|uniref:FxSxx-COOH system tetratricopeptide repeat protein n=1 Tax=Amycolatopsis sp. FBCC-B4732 TaxID=3079339 RepID=UPI001FF494B2|nr:FxSxx-COOH system tetratricopeptide repeat protein [Amycolatopsis sp. FBCC-B4732]UOX89255.1 FxSxx-COOH system tetratricopeptide repeat protein [Amycolatopsis sp. FBCC-B4732]